MSYASFCLFFLYTETRRHRVIFEHKIHKNKGIDADKQNSQTPLTTPLLLKEGQGWLIKQICRGIKLSFNAVEAL